MVAIIFREEVDSSKRMILSKLNLKKINLVERHNKYSSTLLDYSLKHWIIEAHCSTVIAIIFREEADSINRIILSKLHYQKDKP